MAICTYLSNNEPELYSTVSDPDINELLQEVRQATQNRIFIQERTYYVKEWILWVKRIRVTKLYSVYVEIVLPEVQVMNFCPPNDQASSICTNVSKQVVMAYLFGVLFNKNCLKS